MKPPIADPETVRSIQEASDPDTGVQITIPIAISREMIETQFTACRTSLLTNMVELAAFLLDEEIEARGWKKGEPH